MINKMPNEKLANESVPITFIRVLGSPYLRTTALRCVTSIFRHFFFFQWRSAFLPGPVPVSRADHPLDKKIPFRPGKVNIYLDFVSFWVRTIGFLLRKTGRRALEPVKNFLLTMGQLYAFAAEVYRKNLSTTTRPFYIGSPRFLLIHTVDPHLMCIPSLHVMVVIRTFTVFREIIKSMGEEDIFTQQEEELRLGALAITEAVLYVKQHSVNCIPAALYAMTRFDPRLFPPAEVECFVADLFPEAELIDNSDVVKIREYILTLYKRFLIQGEAEASHHPGLNSAGSHSIEPHKSENWTKPLLDFLKELPAGQK